MYNEFNTSLGLPQITREEAERQLLTENDPKFATAPQSSSSSIREDTREILPVDTKMGNSSTSGYLEESLRREKEGNVEDLKVPSAERERERSLPDVSADQVNSSAGEGTFGTPQNQEPEQPAEDYLEYEQQEIVLKLKSKTYTAAELEMSLMNDNFESETADSPIHENVDSIGTKETEQQDSSVDISSDNATRENILDANCVSSNVCDERKEEALINEVLFGTEGETKKNAQISQENESRVFAHDVKNCPNNVVSALEAGHNAKQSSSFGTSTPEASVIEQENCVTKTGSNLTQKSKENNIGNVGEVKEEYPDMSEEENQSSSFGTSTSEASVIKQENCVTKTGTSLTQKSKENNIGNVGEVKEEYPDMSEEENRFEIVKQNKARAAIGLEPIDRLISCDGRKIMNTPTLNNETETKSKDEASKTAPHKKTTRTKHALSSNKSHSTTNGVDDTLPPGWTVKVIERKKKGARADRYWHSPDGVVYRSRKQVDIFLKKRIAKSNDVQAPSTRITRSAKVSELKKLIVPVQNVKRAKSQTPPQHSRNSGLENGGSTEKLPKSTNSKNRNNLKKNDRNIADFECEAEGLPNGWKKRGYKRKNGEKRGIIDTYWFSPSGVKFRSVPEIKKFMRTDPEKSGYDPALITGFNSGKK